ncbi:protein of unknown function [Vibrio tapetis subsp. tapetis]|uniref:Uncharacterized protein n=1 Tax=Vibrio tapetis subsp. tapetis TaxID=1671868 RepID=A0A2N8ZI01_9VIBR|nr:protein of unknown function [Vibrio tapetis subsp. tapetis]
MYIFRMNLLYSVIINFIAQLYALGLLTLLNHSVAIGHPKLSKAV